MTDERAMRERAIQNPDWQQVVLNGGPPCFHIEDDGKLCFRAERWEGHGEIHKYVSLAAFAAAEHDAAVEECCKAVCRLCRDTTVGKTELFDGKWGHRIDSEHYDYCKAAAIRSRVAGKEKR